MTKPNTGHVYILASPVSPFIKIGGTDHAPLKRIREINSCDPYRSLGPWTLSDFRHVTDWRRVERHLHYVFRGKRVEDVAGQKELFRVPPQTASEKLEELAKLHPGLIVARPKIDRMFQDETFATYMQRLFAFTGLLNWLDIQGAWTLSLFPSTGWGRYFTLNIGRHEVAFATTASKQTGGPIHSIVMDRLIYDFPEVRAWVLARRGALRDDVYASALPRSVAVQFSGSFQDALGFLRLDGVRRALIAYWSEGLIQLKERGIASIFARFHNWNAVAELRRRLQFVAT